MLLEAYAVAVCDEEIIYFERGCYNLIDGEELAAYEQDIAENQSEVDHETGRPRCCYKALIAPACNE